MIEIAFTIIIVTLIIAFALYVKESNGEKAKLINALIAKTPEQARDLTLADKVRIEVPQSETPPDIVPLDSLSDEEFDEHVQQQIL